MIGVAVLVAIAALVLVGISIALWRVSSEDAARAASVLQATAAALGLLATAALVGVTAFYAAVTSEILRRSGPDVSVAMQRAWTDGRSTYVVTVPLDGRPDEPVDQHTEPLWAITTRNAGGADVSIDKIGIELHKGKATFTPMQFIGAARIPTRLAAHSTETFVFSIQPGALNATAEILKTEKRRIRATVELGSGETVVSEWKPMPAGS